VAQEVQAVREEVEEEVLLVGDSGYHPDYRGLRSMPN
jgi:hypothetical protein